MQKKRLIFIISFFSFFVISALVFRQCNSDLDKQQSEFFNEFPLTTYGTICKVKKGEGSLKFFVTVKVDSSNFEVYKQKSPFAVYFAVQSKEYLVFLDSYDEYSPGDKICIGCGDNSITLMNNDGSLKFTKKRSDTRLYNISSPNKEMIDQLELGCN